MIYSPHIISLHVAMTWSVSALAYLHSPACTGESNQCFLSPIKARISQPACIAPPCHHPWPAAQQARTT